MTFDPFGAAMLAMAVVLVFLATVVYLVYAIRFTHGRRGPRAAYLFTVLLAALVVALLGIGEIATAAGHAATSGDEDCITNSVARQVQPPTITFPPFPSIPGVLLPTPAPFVPPTAPPVERIPRPSVVVPQISPFPATGELLSACSTNSTASAAHGGVFALVAAIVIALHANIARRMLEEER
jgi:hypothetical protein